MTSYDSQCYKMVIVRVLNSKYIIKAFRVILTSVAYFSSSIVAQDPCSIIILVIQFVAQDPFVFIHVETATIKGKN